MIEIFGITIFYEYDWVRQCDRCLYICWDKNSNPKDYEGWFRKSIEFYWNWKPRLIWNYAYDDLLYGEEGEIIHDSSLWTGRKATLEGVRWQFGWRFNLKQKEDPCSQTQSSTLSGGTQKDL